MELNRNFNRLRVHSLDDDDNLSGNSRSSYGFYNSAFNSDSESIGQLSVRDMIKLYNQQMQKDETDTINHKIKRKSDIINGPSQHLLASTRSSYCGLNNYNSQTNVKQFVDQMEDKSFTNDQHHKAETVYRACVYCQNRSLKNSTTNINKTMILSPLQSNENNKCNQINAKHILVVENNVNPTTSNQQKKQHQTKLNGMDAEFKDDLNKKHNSQVIVEKNQLQHHHRHRLLSTDSVEEAKICQPIETSYQSNTTIAKTSSGVRIITDIFFDQEQSLNATEVVGSRVETDIPQSRILNEFQQQTKTAHAIGGSAEAVTSSNKDHRP